MGCPRMSDPGICECVSIYKLTESKLSGILDQQYTNMVKIKGHL